MTTAQQILEAAYARSTANDPGKLAIDAELLGRLNRSYQGLYALAARQRPDDFAVQTPAQLLGALAQYTLPADLIEIRRIETTALVKVHLIPMTEKDRGWHIAPSMYRAGNILYSRLLTGDPAAGTLVYLWLVTAGTPLVALGSVVDVAYPTRHIDILVNDLALYLDAKDEDRDPAQYQKLVADQAMKLAAFAQDFNLDASALEFVHSPAVRVPAGPVK